MWQQLTELSQLDNLKSISNNSQVVIFKHSTSCGISRMVLRNFEADVKSKDGLDSKLYFLDLLKYRSISNAIAEKFNVQHQSPQLLVLKDGEVIHDSSHHSINADLVN